MAIDWQGTMMDLSHSLTLNEEALAQIPPEKRPLFIFEWLRFLDKVLIAAQKNDIKGCQKKLTQQLTGLMGQSPGPPTRRLLAHCLATLFSVGDTFLLFQTVNRCNDILKNKDDSPSFLTTKLAAICCVGAMYERLGRMMGRSYEETVTILVKSLRSAESQMRIEIMNTLEKVCSGMGSAIVNVHKEIYKAAKHCLTDRVMAVRSAAAKCLVEMLNHAPFMYTTETESLASLCYRAFEGSNYEVRCSVAALLGTLLALGQTSQLQPSQLPAKSSPQATHNSKNGGGGAGGAKGISLEEALTVLMSGFLRGGIGFLKGTGEIIKGSSSVNREIRVGVTHAYVVFLQTLGGDWLERNLSTVLSHILELVANPKAASSHVDAVYSRKCISFVLRSALGKMLGERAQVAAAKEIAAIITSQMNSIDLSLENAKDCNQETLFGQHLMVCALQELGCLVLSLGTTAAGCLLSPDLSNNTLDTVLSVVVHPCQAARLAAAWCLRCISIAIPSQITPLIDRCTEGIEKMRTSAEAISGFSSALAAVLGGVRLSPLGVPHSKGKVIFNTAEELLRSASQNSRLSLHRTQAGWLLIGAIMTLGTPVVKGLLPRMLLLWRNSFPRSNKELDSEKARGDAFTWQVTLEGRAGALSAMHSFLQNCPELVTDEVAKRLLTPVEAALAMLTNISSVLKTYGQHLKAPAAMVRLRLYETLSLLPSHLYENSYTHLLRLLVSEFTLSENPANTSTSQLLRTACHKDILGSWLQETDHRTVEDQMEPNRKADGDHVQQNCAAGSGALEHDPCCLYRPLPAGETVPGPLPLGVAVIDASVTLFGCVFPRVNTKHRLQMLDHLSETLRGAKSSRADALSLNVFSALLAGLKGLTESKASLGSEEVKKSATSLIVSALTSSSAILRCAAGESLGRLAQTVSEPRTTAELAQTSFDRLKSARDVASRTGHSLALGCIHRYVGSLGSAQHLSTSVSILLALAQDPTSPVVQVWALHALYLIADSGGPMFRGYVEPALSLSLKLLLSVPQSHVDVHQCVGKVLTAIITTIGPELQGNSSSVSSSRSSLLCACAIMQDHEDPLVQAEAVSCLQQLHLFAPRHVNLSTLVPSLCRTLGSRHLLLRKAAVACLRQLTQREAREVCEHALTLATENSQSNVEGLVISESGLPGVLFSMLDTETEPELVGHIQDSLTSMLQVLAASSLSQWLSLCKSVLTVANDASQPTTEGDGGGGGGGGGGERKRREGEEEEDEEEGDDAEFQAVAESKRATVQPRWPTRVFAAQSVSRIIAACQLQQHQAPAHFDLVLAKEAHSSKNKGDYLVLHLSELVRMSFMAATSDCDQLRLEGLALLLQVIETFAKVPEPEFPGHLLLEQYQAQVSAALRPAFSRETPADVTAAACGVCSGWIGSGVARDLSDLRRVHQLLVSGLDRLHSPRVLLYNESVLTMERLAILRAWAQVYIVAMTEEKSGGGGSVSPSELPNNDTSSGLEEEFGEFESVPPGGESLLDLVSPQLESLSSAWLAALKDHALLSLPPEFASQLPHDGGAFYTADTLEGARPHYAVAWPPLLQAAALWLAQSQFRGDSAQDRFHLLFGICMEALCSPRLVEPTEVVLTCLKSLFTLLDSELSRQMLMADPSLSIELSNVLHRLLLTREDVQVLELVMEVLSQVLKAAQEDLESRKKKKIEELGGGPAAECSAEVEEVGEGGASGELQPGKSLVFAVLEVCLCLLVGQLPALNPQPGTVGPRPQRVPHPPLVARALDTMGRLSSLTSPQGGVAILPTVLYLTTGVLKECGSRRGRGGEVTGALHCLRAVASHPFASHPRVAAQWKALLQSALAKIIDLSKADCTEGEGNRLDEVTMMLAITVFVLHAPPEVVSAPNLQYPCINHLRRCLQGGELEVKVKCVGSLRSIFSKGEKRTSSGYIQALAPRLLELLHSKPTKQPSTQLELTLCLELISALEALIHLPEPKHRLGLLKLLVPELVDCLLEGPALKEANQFCRSLHQQALHWLKKIGPQYPQEFKAIMAESSDARCRLETAIRSQESQRKEPLTGSTAKPHLAASHLQATVPPEPTIKLKTHFRDFTASS